MFSGISLKNIKKDKYLKRNSKFFRDIEGIENSFKFKCAVIIPAYNEIHYLEQTLSSLFLNDYLTLKTTLILIIVNNPESTSESSDLYINNQQTLSLIKKSNTKHANIAWIDCATKGRGLKGKGGVGLARKIAMDSVLRLLDWNNFPIIFSLDADTVVAENYLKETLNYFKQHEKVICCTIPFKHLPSKNIKVNQAIEDYEFYLNYYVDKLRFAGSPYAYHAIGSAMVFRAEAYIKAGGMKVNFAGEDFYFLQDMRKIGIISEVKKTKVFQSSRLSDRVPFGTGPTIIKNTENINISLYNPEIFVNLKFFLNSIGNWILQEDYNNIQFIRSILSPEMNAFLDKYNFDMTWPGIIKNNIKINKEISESVYRNKLLWCFNIWFDAFKTLKFVHFMERNYKDKYPRISIVKFKKLY